MLSGTRLRGAAIMTSMAGAPIVMKTGASSLVKGSSQKREEEQAHIKDKAEDEAPMLFNLVNDYAQINAFCDI